ncbi:MAG TPA: thiamine diphosphokinase [Anaerolineae bacterium]|nr:thiamine diphosphokinase [Anaerolineae bacterium]
MNAHGELPATGQAVLSFVGGGGCMRAVIIAFGHTEDGIDWQKWIQDGDWILGADGGAARALAWGLVPQVVIGDMDSLTDVDRTALRSRGCRFVEHPRAKDETDLELALVYAVREGAQEILVLGALGGRLDHTLANVLLLTLPSLEGVPVRIVNGDEEAMLVRSGETVTVRGNPGDLVSLLPLRSDAHGVTTSGLAWALHGDALKFGFSRGVSNEMTDSVARIKVDDGYVLVVHRSSPEG